MKSLTKIAIITASILLSHLNPSYAKDTIGKEAPQFIATKISGSTFDLSQFKGKKPVYIKFWATWCSYCKAEMPHLKAIEQEYGEKVEVVTINVGINDSIENISDLYRKLNFSLPTIFDQEGKLTAQYGVVGTPHHILIDKSGNIAYRTFLANDKLDSIIKAWSVEGNTKMATSYSIEQGLTKNTFYGDL